MEQQSKTLSKMPERYYVFGINQKSNSSELPVLSQQSLNKHQKTSIIKVFEDLDGTVCTKLSLVRKDVWYNGIKECGDMPAPRNAQKGIIYAIGD